MQIRIALSAVALMFAAVGCSSSSVAGHGHPGPAARPTVVFDEKIMARDIERQSSNNEMPLENVTCPANEAVYKGHRFDCHAAYGITIQINVTSDKGDYLWSPVPTR